MWMVKFRIVSFKIIDAVYDMINERERKETSNSKFHSLFQTGLGYLF